MRERQLGWCYAVTSLCAAVRSTSGKCTNNWWKFQQQLPGRWQAGQRWVDNFKSALVDKLGLSMCVSAPQFFWSAERQVGDGDAHGRCAWFWPGPTSGEKFKKDLAIHIRFRDGGVHHDGAEYDHLTRFRKKFSGVTTLEANRNFWMLCWSCLVWKAQWTCPLQAFVRTRNSS